MRRRKELVSAIFLGVAAICIPMYWAAGTLVFGIIGFVSMAIGNILLLLSAVNSFRKNPNGTKCDTDIARRNEDSSKK